MHAYLGARKSKVTKKECYSLTGSVGMAVRSQSSLGCRYVEEARFQIHASLASARQRLRRFGSFGFLFSRAATTWAGLERSVGRSRAPLWLNIYFRQLPPHLE